MNSFAWDVTGRPLISALWSLFLVVRDCETVSRFLEEAFGLESSV